MSGLVSYLTNWSKGVLASDLVINLSTDQIYIDEQSWSQAVTRFYYWSGTMTSFSIELVDFYINKSIIINIIFLKLATVRDQNILLVTICDQWKYSKLITLQKSFWPAGHIWNKTRNKIQAIWIKSWFWKVF